MLLQLMKMVRRQIFDLITGHHHLHIYLETGVEVYLQQIINVDSSH